MNSRFKNITFIGNPNSGKTSLFNLLTGLRHKTGNFPGVTVDKKHTTINLLDYGKVNIIDLPGCYSLYPTAYDEKVVFQILADPSNKMFPDVIVYIADATQLERHLLLFTQLKDLNIPIILCLNMHDLTATKNITVNTQAIESIFGNPVFWMNGRTGEGLDVLKNHLVQILSGKSLISNTFESYIPDDESLKLINSVKELTGGNTDFQNLLVVHHCTELNQLDHEKQTIISRKTKDFKFNSLKTQVDETMQRFAKIDNILRKHLKINSLHEGSFTERLDRILTNSVWGPLIFIGIMVIIFQAVFSWAVWPMDKIEEGIGLLTKISHTYLPNNWATTLLTEGILSGLGGVLVFIPQIAILFLFTSFLEEIGYMSRAVYLFDRLMGRFGLNGRSIVSLVSGAACAIPAIMSARTINNWKERLITIMVTPLISCSARLPVFAVLISFVVTDNKFYGPFSLRGLILLLLYCLGIMAALVAAGVFKRILKTKEMSFLMIELPEYKMPSWKNVLLTVFDKVKSFVTQAGGIIIIISIILWFGSSFGPGNSMEQAKNEAIKESNLHHYDAEQTQHHIASKKLENSYAGHLGKWIEPAIRPIGFDWKIGIALITSFAAREVFIGTMSTIYSIGDSEQQSTQTLQYKMSQEMNHNTGQKTFSFAASMSLLMFYLYAMQCMSTLAVVKKETGTWKWPIIQFVYMSALAYFSSWIVYSLLS